MSAAIARAVANGSALAGSAMRPMRYASSASMRRPVSARYFTRLAPISLARRCVPDQPGTVPIEASGSPNVAAVVGDADVGDRGEFQSAAERMSVDRGDDRQRAAAPTGRTPGGRA